MMTRALGALALAVALAATGCSGSSAGSCTPKCDGRQCGDDGCGRTCGSCGAGQRCNVEFRCVPDRCPSRPGTITVDTLCDTINGAYDKWYVWNYRSCGAAVRPEDIPHLDAMAPIGVGGVISQIGAQSAVMTCDASLKATYEAMRASVINGRLCFDRQAADACAEAGRTLASQSRYGAPEPEVCSKIFSPAVAEDEECLYSYECSPDHYCRPNDDGVACTGRCVRPRVAGEPCTRLDLCGPQTYCARSDEDGVERCKAMAVAGEACDYLGGQLSCATGAWCELDENQNTVCRPAKAAGEACAANVQCAQGFACLPSEGGTTCQQVPAPGTLDQPCGGPTQVTCDADACLFCDGETADQAGVCKRFPAAGEPCRAVPMDNGSTSWACDRYALLVCDMVTMQCAPKAREGEPCTVTPSPGYPAESTSAGNCLYLDNYCKRASADAQGVCTRPPKVGERCRNRYDSSPNCADPTSFCKGVTDTHAGVCALPMEDDSVCLGDSECVSGFCARGSATQGRCAQPPGAGEPCAMSQGNVPRCDSKCWCEGIDSGSDPVCRLLGKPGEECTSRDQCESGLCDTDAQKCVLVCDQVQRSSCWDGLDWLSKYIFASGAVGLFAFRRRRREPEA